MKKENAAKRAADKKREAKAKVKAKAFQKADAKREAQKKGGRRPGGRTGRPHDYEENADAYTPAGRGRSGVSGDTEKAYKLLAMQEGVSNAQAKSMIDRGLVYVGNKKVMIARGELKKNTEFIVQRVEKVRPIFENDDLIVVDKPAFLNADEVERQFKGARLLHRLDRETSGVLMLAKNETFRERAIEAFRKDEVYKEYVAWVEGVFIEETVIDKPILTEKRQNKAYSKISKKGKPARSEVYPLEVSGKKSKVRVIIHEGRTHQIRVHLRSVDHPIVGDEMYGGRRYKRVMLHAKKVKLLGMTFEAPEPKLFAHFSS
jgi:23S rRNA pseudouridine1911/1915/1917 synthase